MPGVAEQRLGIAGLGHYAGDHPHRFVGVGLEQALHITAGHPEPTAGTGGLPCAGIGVDQLQVRAEALMGDSMADGVGLHRPVRAELPEGLKGTTGCFPEAGGMAPRSDQEQGFGISHSGSRNPAAPSKWSKGIRSELDDTIAPLARSHHHVLAPLGMLASGALGPGARAAWLAC